jgi:methyl-accepting chemotaxis protein
LPLSTAGITVPDLRPGKRRNGLPSLSNRSMLQGVALTAQRLTMALVKTSEIQKRRGSRAADIPADPPVRTKSAPPSRHTNGKPQGRRRKAAERIAAATEQLASGVAEATAAAEELSRALEQIASGADEAASASQQSLASINALGASFGQAREHATISRRRTEVLQGLLIETASQIDTSVAAILANARRQARSVEVISVLERHAVDIGEITRMVGEVSDQTNLLALNGASRSWLTKFARLRQTPSGARATFKIWRPGSPGMFVP